MTNVAKYIGRLRAVAWRTSGARFNAARRLRRRDLLSAISIATFSAIGVFAVVLARILDVPPNSIPDRYLTALSVCLGLFVIVISLVEWGYGASLKAERLYRNAEELNAFQRRLEQLLAEIADGDSIASSEISNSRENYERIKESCPYNHEPMDDKLFLAQHWHSPDVSALFTHRDLNWIESTYYRAVWFIGAIWYFGIFWAIVLGLCWAGSLEFLAAIK